MALFHVFFVLLGLCFSSCFVDAKKQVPLVHDIIGETTLSGIITERCFAEGIHRHLQLYPACQDWVRSDEVPRHLFESMPATWMANALAEDNAMQLPPMKPKDEPCDNECLLRHFAGLCNTAAMTAFGWVDLTCDRYQQNRTVDTIEGNTYPGSEGPWDWFVPEPFSWGYYRTVQAVVEMAGPKVIKEILKNPKLLEKWLPDIDHIWEKKEHRHTWRWGDPAVKRDERTESLVEKRDRDPKKSCRRKGPCGSTLPWHSSSLVPGVLEVMMNPRLTVENLHGYVGRRACIPSDVRRDDRWFQRMSAILRTALLNDVLRKQHILRYVLEAAYGRGSTELNEPMPLYPERTFWRWAPPKGSSEHAPEHHHRLQNLVAWYDSWQLWKKYEPNFLNEIKFDLGLLALRKDHVYMHLTYDRVQERTSPQYLRFVSDRKDQELALTKNNVLEFEVLGQDMKPTGHIVYRRAKDVVELAISTTNTTSPPVCSCLL